MMTLHAHAAEQEKKQHRFINLLHPSIFFMFTKPLARPACGEGYKLSDV